MPPRSPLRGFNHNIRYAGRLFHVQTEDSGLQNPHIFTHLFFTGTILASKRCVYDPASSDADVKAIMQTQHKAMLKELRAGEVDARIEQFFGEPVVRDEADARIEPDAPAAAPPPHRPITPVRPPRRALAPQTIHSPVAPIPPTPRPAAAPVAARGSAGRSANPPPRQAVVVARPAMIVGVGIGQPRRVSDSPPPAPPAGNSPTGRHRTRPPGNIFGEQPVHEKSLDDVILAYLSEEPAKK